MGTHRQGGRPAGRRRPGLTAAIRQVATDHPAGVRVPGVVTIGDRGDAKVGGERDLDDHGDIVQVVPLLGVRTLDRRVFDYRLADAPRARGRARAIGDARTEEAGEEDVVGAVVRAPFGRREVMGVVVARGASAGHRPADLRTARRVGEGVVPPDLLALADRLAAYYLAPLGGCLQAVVPTHLVPRARSPRGRAVQWVCATGAPAELTERQRVVLSAVPEQGSSVADLMRLTGAGRGVIDALVAVGALARESRRVIAGPEATTSGEYDEDGPSGGGDAVEAGDPYELTDEQRAVLTELEAALAAPTAERRLLWGVTGSGKTELYVRLIRRVVRAGGGAILLVPEIALSNQLVERVQRGLGERVAVIHSARPPQRRAVETAALAEGAVRVVVGARSAVFAPVRDLRLIIVDEAHDSSYKQDEEPRYDARTVAWWRLEEGAGLLVEGTATPRLESLSAAGRPLRLRRRPGAGVLPTVEVVDMRRQGARGVLAPRTRTAIAEVLRRGEQVIVLLNRRGYAGFVRCGECGHVPMCPSCEISLTYHRERSALECHHCGHVGRPPALCPACGAAPMERGAPGTERLRDELLRLVPRSRLFRLDSDVVTSGSRVRDVLGAFAEARPGVLVGTQMVAKGHDFPGVTLAVVADADTALYLPDFRAGERTFQLLTQVSGRAGRRDTPGLVLVQTWNPDVPCIRMAVAQRDEEFYAEEGALRERLGYPPFRELVRVLTISSDGERSLRAGEYLAERLSPYLADDELRGPARLPRLRRQERTQLLVAARDGSRARALVRSAVDALRVPYARRGVDLVVDVDPQWFM